MPENFDDRTSRPEFQTAIHGEQNKGKDSEMVKGEQPVPALRPDGPDAQAVNNAQHRRRMNAEPAQQERAAQRLADYHAERAARERENEARSETFAREAQNKPRQDQDNQQQSNHMPDPDIEHRASPYVRKESEKIKTREELAAKRLAEFRQTRQEITQERSTTQRTPPESRPEDFNRSTKGRDKSDDDMGW